MAAVSVKGKVETKITSNDPNPKQKTCFVIMPIADHPDYPAGHFARVYEHIIKPACVKAGFLPDRADDAQHTHVIMMNILQRILDADIAICDLSSKNPNVMYELGIRQAFDKPVSLIKDDKTTRVFDTGMLSDVEYSSDLRIDTVQEAIDAIATRLKNTYDKKGEQPNSLIQLMKIQPAEPPKTTIVSTDTNVVLEAIAMLGRRISQIEDPLRIRNRRQPTNMMNEHLVMERERLRATINALSEKMFMLHSKIESLGEDDDDLSTRSMREQMLMSLRENECSIEAAKRSIETLNEQIHATQRYA